MSGAASDAAVSVRRLAPSAGGPLARAAAEIERTAAPLGLRLEAVELVHGDGGGVRSDAYWVVSDLPADLRFRDLAEARGMIAEQLHVRVSGHLGSEGDHEKAVVELDFLRWLVEREADLTRERR